MLYNSFRITAVLFLLISSASALSQEKILQEYKERLLDQKIDPAKQTLCFSQDGTNYSLGQNLAQNPASVTKLFTSFWAIKNLGTNHKFETKLYKQGKEIFLKSSGDPYLLSQQLILLIRELIKSGETQFDTLYVQTNLRLDWKQNQNYLKAQLLKLFNPKKWDQEIQTILEESNLLGKVGQDFFQQFSVKKIELIEEINLKSPFMTLKSPPLYRQLKEVNKYSNNFYFDQMLKLLGGEVEFNQFIARELGIPRSSFHFYSGSGLGKNYIQCDHALKLLKALQEELTLQSISLNDVLPIAGTDKGTLVNRMQNWKGSSWAKTGTLRRTSALAGITKRTNGYEYFIFLNSTDKLPTARKLQDETLEEIYISNGDVVFIDYIENVLDITKESLVE